MSRDKGSRRSTRKRRTSVNKDVMDETLHEKKPKATNEPQVHANNSDDDGDAMGLRNSSLRSRRRPWFCEASSSSSSSSWSSSSSSLSSRPVFVRATRESSSSVTSHVAAGRTSSGAKRQLQKTSSGGASNVICILSDSDENDDDAKKPTEKKPRTQTPTPTLKTRPRDMKMSAAVVTQSSTKSDKKRTSACAGIQLFPTGKDNHADDVEAMEPLEAPLELFDPKAANKKTKSSKSDDDEVEAVGGTHILRLPHMRQHCPDHKFVEDCAQNKDNAPNCLLCFCYVCDIPASQCTKWYSTKRNLDLNHCCASDNGMFSSSWKEMREKTRKKNMEQKSSVACESFQRPHCEVLGTSNPFETPLDHRNRFRVGLGPFPPTNEEAGKCDTLTQCRYCKYYNAFEHQNFTRPRQVYSSREEKAKEDKQTVGSTRDWCQACGRVPSERVLEKQRKSLPFKPDATDVFLGTRHVHFRLQSHDPRQIKPFQQMWRSSASKEPTWSPYSEEDMDFDTFWHRLGDRPTMSMVLQLLPSRKTLPKTGVVVMDGKDMVCPNFDDEDAPNATETAALVLENASDRVLLEELRHWSCVSFFATRYSSKVCAGTLIGGRIVATWDKELRKGALKLSLYLRKPAFAESSGSAASESSRRFSKPKGARLACTLRAWFQLDRFRLVDLLHANTRLEISGDEDDDESTETLDEEIIPIETDSYESIEKRKEEERKAVQAANHELRKRSKQLHNFRCSSWKDVHVSGGVLSSDITWQGTMRRFYKECLPYDVVQTGQSNWTKNWKHHGVANEWRPTRRGAQEISCGTITCGRRAPTASYVREEDHALLAMSDLEDSFELLVEKTATLPGLFSHLENLGHAAAPQVDGLTVELFDFQRQAVQFAIEREKAPGGIQRYWWTEVPKTSRDERTLYFCPILDQVSLKEPRIARGGILAQEMGLGKTVITLALLLSNPAPEHPVSGTPTAGFVPTDNNAATCVGWSSRASEKRDNPKRASIFSRGTLVVCSVSLVGQWVDEARSKLKDPGQIYSYYGSSRQRDPQFLSNCAIVVTTYQTLSSDATYHAEKADTDDYCAPLEQIYWHRIVVDESHTCKHQSHMVKMLMSVEGEHKWAVSGTPINTSISNLRNQLKFIGIEHVDAMFQLFEKQMPSVAKGCVTTEGGHENAGPFFFLMRSILIRHSMKQQRHDGSRGLMELPPKEEHSLNVSFTLDERRSYDDLEKRAMDDYKELRCSRKKLETQYLRVMSMLQPLRMACSGGSISAQDEAKDGKAAGSSTEKCHRVEGESTTCSICQENMKDPVATMCNHVFCRECITGMMGTDDGKCPLCQRTVQSETLRRAILPDHNRFVLKTPKAIFRSKLDYLIQNLQEIRDQEPKSKSLVFTQFASTLEWLKQELPKNGFQYRTLEGVQSMTQRARALRDFQNDPPTTIFLLSLRAGAVGINLTQANRVFLLEPAFNPALEAQAIGRVHRIGQQSKVKIYKLVMESSVESRLTQLVRQKYGGGTTKSCFAGSLQSDSMSVMKSDFDMLFGYGATAFQSGGDASHC